jgi:histidine triad (HIT) family protein
MNTCIFCDIAAGKANSHKVGENAKALAFMDINPVDKGHLLVIPKAHAVNIFDVDESDLREVIALVKKSANAAMKAFSALGVEVIAANGRAAGQVVMHLHFHVIPRYEAGGHGRGWNAKRASDNELSQDAEAIRKAMG